MLEIHGRRRYPGNHDSSVAILATGGRNRLTREGRAGREAEGRWRGENCYGRIMLSGMAVAATVH